MMRFNKTSVTAAIGAVAIFLTAFWPDIFSGQKVAAVQTLLSTLAVFLVPNVES